MISDTEYAAAILCMIQYYSFVLSLSGNFDIKYVYVCLLFIELDEGV